MNAKTADYAISLIEKQKAFISLEKEDEKRKNQQSYVNGMVKIMSVFQDVGTDEEKRSAALFLLNSARKNYDSLRQQASETMKAYWTGMETMLRLIISEAYNNFRDVYWTTDGYVYKF